MKLFTHYDKTPPLFSRLRSAHRIFQRPSTLEINFS